MTHTGRASEIEQGPFELDAFVISLVGEFDIAERARLLDAFAIVTTAAVVVIDLAETRYLDSTVIECIVALKHAVAERGARLVLVGLSPDIRRIVEICNLERLLEIRPSLGDVTSELSGDAPRLRRLSLIAEPLETTEPPPN